ncbi:hypothetical protein FV229_15505 [Methylobacterium sp. WL120]|nr:hypothetical protein FV229_15505 [Methylobacterium sp. WL120]
MSGGARIPSPRLRGEGLDDRVVGKARRQPRVRGRERTSLLRSRPLTVASASPSLPGRTTGCSRASPRTRGEGGRPIRCTARRRARLTFAPRAAIARVKIPFGPARRKTA